MVNDYEDLVERQIFGGMAKYSAYNALTSSTNVAE